MCRNESKALADQDCPTARTRVVAQTLLRRASKADRLASRSASVHPFGGPRFGAQLDPGDRLLVLGQAQERSCARTYIYGVLRLDDNLRSTRRLLQSQSRSTESTTKLCQLFLGRNIGTVESS